MMYACTWYGTESSFRPRNQPLGIGSVPVCYLDRSCPFHQFIDPTEGSVPREQSQLVQEVLLPGGGGP